MKVKLITYLKYSLKWYQKWNKILSFKLFKNKINKKDIRNKIFKLK